MWDQVYPTTVNAYYEPFLNDICMLALGHELLNSCNCISVADILEGIMRAPFFNPGWPL